MIRRPPRSTLLSLHDALPISSGPRPGNALPAAEGPLGIGDAGGDARSEEHTSELQSQSNLVCRLLLEKKKRTKKILINSTLPSISSTISSPTCVSSSRVTELS